MAARTSSAEGGTPAEYSPGVSGLRDYLETWKGRLAETGWELATHAKAMKPGGDHGYDNASPDMAAIFIANGPAIRKGVRLETFDNVDVYPLVAKLIGMASQ